MEERLEHPKLSEMWRIKALELLPITQVKVDHVVHSTVVLISWFSCPGVGDSLQRSTAAKEQVYQVETVTIWVFSSRSISSEVRSNELHISSYLSEENRRRCFKVHNLKKVN